MLFNILGINNILVNNINSFFDTVRNIQIIFFLSIVAVWQGLLNLKKMTLLMIANIIRETAVNSTEIRLLVSSFVEKESLD